MIYRLSYPNENRKSRKLSNDCVLNSMEYRIIGALVKICLTVWMTLALKMYHSTLILECLKTSLTTFMGVKKLFVYIDIVRIALTFKCWVKCCKKNEFDEFISILFSCDYSFL